MAYKPRDDNLQIRIYLYCPRGFQLCGSEWLRWAPVAKLFTLELRFLVVLVYIALTCETACERDQIILLTKTLKDPKYILASRPIKFARASGACLSLLIT